MTRREAAPAFQAYAADLLADNAGLSHEQFGILLRLAMYAWREGGLPDDLPQLARRVGMTTPAFRKLWPAIAPSFATRAEYEGSGPLSGPLRPDAPAT